MSLPLTRSEWVADSYQKPELEGRWRNVTAPSELSILAVCGPYVMTRLGPELQAYVTCRSDALPPVVAHPARTEREMISNAGFIAGSSVAEASVLFNGTEPHWLRSGRHGWKADMV